MLANTHKHTTYTHTHIHLLLAHISHAHTHTTHTYNTHIHMHTTTRAHTHTHTHGGREGSMIELGGYLLSVTNSFEINLYLLISSHLLSPQEMKSL